MPTDAERYEAKREALKQEALREMFPELSKGRDRKKELELRLMIRDQLNALLPPTNANSLEELVKMYDERWYRWVSTERTGAEIWIGMEIHWYQCREEIRAMEARPRK